MANTGKRSTHSDLEEKELRNRRKSLFDSFPTNPSPNDIYSFQMLLIDEIKRSEEQKKKNSTPTLKWHLHLTRCYGDAVAWHLLHPHTIRQLAKHPGDPAHLTSQGAAFDKCVEIAKAITDQGIPTIIADITHCIKIGDLVACTDSENPFILECKSSSVPPALERIGRRGRQLSRILGTKEYLEKGFAHVFGESKPRFAVETEHEPEFNWRVVNEVAREAIARGQAHRIVSKDEIIFANTKETEFQLPDELDIGKFRTRDALVGLHMVSIEEGSPSVPPPLAWEVDNELKFLLTEGDIFLTHIVSPLALLGYRNEKGQIIKVDVSLEKHETTGCVVRVGDNDVEFTNNFTADLVYGYQTMESVAQGMIDAAARLTEMNLEDPLEQDRTPPNN